MNALRNATDDQTLVLGAGATGMSVARWLRRHGRSAVFADTRSHVDVEGIRQALPEVDIITDAGPDVLDGKSQIIVSPGIADHEPLVAAGKALGIPMYSDIAIFAREAAAPIVAVTGTNGKSTVVSLLAHMCRQADMNFAAGGNLGTPALDLPALAEDGVYLLELSSFQLARTPNLELQCACVLNIEPDHLDWHGDYDAYRDAKLSIYRNCGYAVTPADMNWPDDGIDPDAVRVSFGVTEPSDRRGVGVVEAGGQRFWCSGGERVLAIDEAALVGEHNVLNVAAALAIGTSIDLPLSAMIAAIRSFPGLDHRHQFVAERDGVRYVDDSKATNCAAALASAAAVAGPVVLLAGGLGKGEDYDAFVAALSDNVVHVVVYGALSETLQRALHNHARAHTSAESLESAVHSARLIASPGNTVLLAPAAASQDAYANFIERGRHFRAVVEALTP
ncbi:MAG: UDP-N-acetylmuramoyl-L-alanine--D-glutamate ligase [Pseudomonadota bacterium]